MWKCSRSEPGQQFFGTTHEYRDDHPQTMTPADDIPVTVRILSGGDPVVAQRQSASTTLRRRTSRLELLTPAIDEGVAAKIRVTFDDPGLLDAHSVVVDWADGTTQVLAVASGRESFEAEHHYRDDNPTGTAFDLYDIGSA